MTKLLIAFFIISLSGFTKVHEDPFNKLFKKYSTSSLVTMDVNKLIKSDLLGTEKKQSGKLYYSKEKFRLSFFDPAPEMVVYDGKSLWMEQGFEA